MLTTIMHYLLAKAVLMSTQILHLAGEIRKKTAIFVEAILCKY